MAFEYPYQLQQQKQTQELKRVKGKDDKTEGQNYFQCPDCNYKSPSRRIINTHRKKKHSTEFGCDQCNFKANSKAGVDKHNEAKHGGICYICELCVYNCNNMRAFLKHKRNNHGLKQIQKDVLKYPVPPKPVLSMQIEEIKSWFPSFFSKLSFEIKARCEAGQPKPAWIKDIEDVISLSSLKMLAKNWGDLEQSFFWKLKLVSAIVLDHKGFDYTDFAMSVPVKHARYSVEDLKMMSKTKNHSTFESMFV